MKIVGPNRWIIRIIEEIICLLNDPDTDMCWSHYDSAQYLIDELRGYIEQLHKNDISPIKPLKILFLPTGEFQEIAESSGWGRRYLQLSQQFDTASALRLFVRALLRR